MLWETKLVCVILFKDSATKLWKWLDVFGGDTGLSKIWQSILAANSGQSNLFYVFSGNEMCDIAIMLSGFF